jgi:hypothetical protein
LRDLPVNEQRRHACFIDKSICLLKLRLGEPQKSNGGAREAGSDNSCEYPRAATDPHLDHDQPEKGVHCVGTDVHSIRNLFVGKALQQQLHRLLLASRELKLLGDPRKKKQS